MFYQSRSDNLYSLNLGFVGSYMMWAPLMRPISCSSWGLANVLILTRPGIKRGFLPLLLAVALVASVGCYCHWRVVQWVYSSIFLRISLSPPVLDLTSALFGASEGSDCRVLSLDSGSSWIASCLWSCDYVLPLFVQHHKQDLLCICQRDGTDCG